jgi:hypothetical protein
MKGKSMRHGRNAAIVVAAVVALTLLPGCQLAAEVCRASSIHEDSGCQPLGSPTSASTRATEATHAAPDNTDTSSVSLANTDGVQVGRRPSVTVRMASQSVALVTTSCPEE